MQLTVAPRVKETSTTTGTGSYALAGTVTGFQTFVSGIGNGKTCRYAATDGTNFEEGIGTVTDGTPDTLSRTYITGSSNGGAAVNWGAGTKTIVCAETAGLIEQLLAGEVAGDPNGLVNPETEWSFAFDNSTRTLTLTPVGATASLWSNGIKFTKSSAVTSAHPDTEGNHYFYFDDTGALVNTMTFSTDLILKYAIASIVYWDATNNLAIPAAQYELHGCILGAYEHLIRHVTTGSVFNKMEGGLTPTVTLGDGSSDTHIQVSSTSGSFYDEDIPHAVPSESAGTNKVKLYRSGANGDWRMASADAAIIRTGGSGRAVFNEFTGGAWQDTECTDGYFMHVYRYAVNCRPAFCVYIQGQAQYATIEAAQAAAQVKPSLGALPGYEFLLVQSFIVQTATAYTNTFNARIVATHTGAGWYDWRESMPQAGSGSAGGSGTALSVNAASLSTANLSDTAPAVLAGGANVKWQQTAGDVSGYVDNRDLLTASRKKPFYYTDFIGGAGAATMEPHQIWDLGLISSGTQAKIAGGVDHPGILRISSSATANSGAYIISESASMLLQGGEIAEFIFQHRVAGGTNTTLRMGFHDCLTSADAVDGAYFEIPANSLAISGKTANNSTRSTTGTSYTLTVNTWYRAILQVGSGASAVYFSVYDMAGTQLWTNNLSTNIPTGAGRNVGHGVTATNSGTVATLLVYLDWMAMGYAYALTR